MSTKAYGLDLRKRVINRIKSGKSQRSVASYYEISKSAVNQWWNRYLSENTIEAKKAPGNKGKIDPKALEDFVIKNPNMIISDAAKAFKVSNAAIHKLLKKLKFSYKKKASPTLSQYNTFQVHTQLVQFLGGITASILIKILVGKGMSDLR